MTELLLDWIDPFITKVEADRVSTNTNDYQFHPLLLTHTQIKCRASLPKLKPIALLFNYLSNLFFMAFQLSGKFKRIERGSGKNILKWTSEKQLLFNEDENVIYFTRKATGFVEVDKAMKLSHLYLDSNRDGLLDDGDELLFTDELGYSKKLYKAKKGKFKATNVVADLSEIMGDDIDLSEEIAEGDHSTWRSIFNMTKKNGLQMGFVYMGHIEEGYDDIMCSAGPVTEPLSEWCAEIGLNL